MKITYYLEVISSWCYWAEPTWAELKRRYAGRAEFAWKIAQMNASDYPVSREQCDWFYRRSGMVMRSPFMLSSGWFDPVAEGTVVASNLVAEAARTLGITGDEVRLALTRAGERDGQKILRMEVAVKIAAEAGNLDPARLRATAESAETRTKVEASTKEFFAHQINQRPAFVIEDSIG